MQVNQTRYTLNKFGSEPKRWIAYLILTSSLYGYAAGAIVTGTF